jgi:hypothetical protein
VDFVKMIENEVEPDPSQMPIVLAVAGSSVKEVFGLYEVTQAGKYSKVAPALKRSDRISNQVSWPWAKKSVQFYGTGTCWIGHAKSGSTVDKRFASAALKHIANGENMGCGMYGGAQKSTLAVVRMWQAEKAWGGPHWKQIKDRDFKSAGAGVARYGKRKTQIVMNFYGKVVN